MTPQARLSAAVEVLDNIARTRAPADAVLREWGRAHRFAGSGDRRAIAERVYACLRGRARFAWRMAGDDGRALVLGSLAECDTVHEIEGLFTGEGHAPAVLSDAEREQLRAPAPAMPAHVRAGIPEWLVPEFERAFGDPWVAQAHALVSERAPVDLRVNTLKATRDAVAAELDAAGIQYEHTHWSDVGLRLHPETDVQSLPAFKEGRVEVQDESSQIAAWLSGAGPGMTVVDYCAGGGGKTLALATLLDNSNFKNRHPGLVPGPAVGVEALLPDGSPAGQHNPNSEPTGGSRDEPGMTGNIDGEERGEREGRLYAFDVNPDRLDAIRPRLKRAGVTAELRPIGPDGQGTSDLTATADLVFVDAPCSGSGTWRRRPEDPWRLTPAELDRLHALQTQILAKAATLVRPGGRLVYATCSVLPREDEDTVAAFAAAHPHFRPVPISQALDPVTPGSSRDVTPGLSRGAPIPEALAPVIPGSSRDVIPGSSRGAPNLSPLARTRLAALAGTGHTLRLSPRLSGTDGFFIALFERNQ
ncbi:MAG TPA: RsmB/NOP family class I SAM-dependent RNA methyltransferase [Caulobacteraceae bacterium]|nr:RsmB/NOP family class I SAM-dependent RNA methyltransferase [Caulobacteraceae bacterium]